MPDPIAGMTGAGPMGGLHGSVDNAMNALGGMDSEGFLNLLVAQLRYQSPLEPADPGDLMTQTAALAQLDATQQLLSAQQQGMALQQATTAAGMLGTQVEALDEHGDRLTGIVDGVRYSVYGPILDVSGTEVYLSDVRAVRRPDGEASTTSGLVDEATHPSDPVDETTQPSGLLAGPSNR